MKTRNKLTAALLLLAMVLSLFGTGVAGAAEGEAVTVAVTEPELAWAPLAQDAVIAYERHEAGYTAALDYAGDNVTLNLTAVPAEETGRAQENARLYIRTGVVLTPGKTYRVGFSLWAEKAQPSYAVCLDGAWAEGAYGMLEHRSIPAGGVDRVQYQFTPQADCGELVLRLLLGKTGAAGNAIRLSGLSVQEVAADEVGQNVVLADHLNYNASGVVRAWANSDCGATLTCTEDSATLTVTKRPDWPSVMPEDEADCPVQVWKIKLLVSTGLKPEPGKLYHLTMDIDSTDSELYELCLNEGTTEKGYGVKYNQQMTFGKQTVNELVAVPEGKSDPGELVVQLSLGKFKVGSKVTVSNVHIEEAKTKYAGSLLPDTFSLRSATSVWTQESDKTETSSKDVTTPIPWGINAGVSSGGDRAGEVSVVGGQVTMKVAPSADLEKDGVWNARLNFDTGETLKAGKSYLVSYAIQSNQTYGEYEALYGTGYKDNGADNNGAYIERKGLSLTANTKKTDSWLIRPEADGALLITLQMGKIDRAATVTVSDLKIEEVTLGAPTGDDLAKVVYPDASTPSTTPAAHSFSIRVDSGHGGELTGDGESSVSMTCTGGAGDAWQRGLFAANVCALKAGYSYQVSYKILSTTDVDSYEVRNNKTGASPDFFEGEDGYGKKDELPALKAGVEQTVSYAIEKAATGNLSLRFDLGVADTDTVITIRDIQVTMTAVPDSGSTGTGSTGENMAKVNYPTVRKVGGDAGAFEVRSETDYTGELFGGDGSVGLICTGSGHTQVWSRGILVRDGDSDPGLGTLEEGENYKVSFMASASNSTNVKVSYNKDKNFGDGKEEGYGSKWQELTDTPAPFEYEIKNAAAGKLVMCICLGEATEGTVFTASDFKVQKLEKQAEAENLTNVTYPTVEKVNGDPGAFEVRAETDYTGELSGDGESVTLKCTGSGHTQVWSRGILVRDWDSDPGLGTLEEGESYKVSFMASASNSTNVKVSYNKDKNFGDGKEEGYGNKWQTVTSEPAPFEYVIENAAAGKLVMCICLGEATEDTVFTASDFKVQKLTLQPTGDNLAKDLVYPSGGEEQVEPGSFKVREDSGMTGTITGGNGSATITCTGDTGDGWQRELFAGNLCDLTGGKDYTISFDVTASEAITYKVQYCKSSGGLYENEEYFGYEENQTAGTTKNTVTHRVTAQGDGPLSFRLQLGHLAAGTTVTVSNIQVVDETAGSSSGSTPELTPGNLATVTYPAADSSETPAPVSFRSRESGNFKAGITGNGSSAVIACTGGHCEAWQRGVFVDNVATLEKGHYYEVSADVSASVETVYEICYNKDDHFGAGKEKGFGARYGLTAGAAAQTVKYTFAADADSKLLMLFNLGNADDGAVLTVSGIHVREVPATVAATTDISGFGAIWEEHDGAYTAELTKTADSAILAVTGAPASTSDKWQGYNTKLFIRTGFVPAANSYYKVSFKIKADKAQSAFHALYNGTEVKAYDGEYNIGLAAGVEKTVTHVINAGASKGELVLQLELGLIDRVDGNTFTVRDVKIEKTTYRISRGFENQLAYSGSSPVLRITNTPFGGEGPFDDEEWKVKMFIDTGLQTLEDETYRVSFKLTTDDETKIKVCYNRDDVENGYGTEEGVRTEGTFAKEVEHTFSPREEEETGKLIIQLMLGAVEAPNRVMVSDLKIERVLDTYSGKSALPKEILFRSPGAVDYWAHEDYTVNFVGTDDAITANIIGAPAKGAEPWKIKLFLDTAVTFQPGKYYRVTADVEAKSTQDIEICYNNGGIEMGYDSLGGIHLAGGESQTVEKIVSVPAGKSDVNNLMLQFNLGRTNIPNAITVSGVKVEEVSLAYGNVMPANFAYTEGDTITSWTNPDYTTSLDAGNGKATLHILEPASAEVWKAKLLVHTGAMLAAGKTYLVRADLLADKSQGYEVCYNNEETEKGFDVLYGQSITGGVKKTVEKSISVPASMTDAGELVLQFSVGGGVVNDFTVSNVSVQELSFGSAGGNLVPGTVVNAANAEAGRNVLRCSTAAGSELTVTGARLRAGDPCAISFNAKSDWNLPGTLLLRRVGDESAVLSQPFMITAENQLYTFTTAAPLAQGGVYELAWQFDPASGAGVEITDLTVTYPGETLTIQHAVQNVSVNGVPVEADTYNINQGNNYIKLRDLAMLLNDTDAQFAVRYNAKSNTISLTSGKTYSPIGGELTVGADLSACCARSFQDLTVNGETVNLKAYNFGGYNFFRIRDLSAILGFQVDYIAETNTVAIQSPMTPEAQEKAHAYDLFFLPEIDGESQPYVGDTMPFYENGTYYIYYLKDGGDAYNHSVYLVTTQDFVHYTEYDDPVLHASREDVQDSWIGTGSVVKADGTYYFFYTGFNSSGSQEYHEKIMVAKSTSPMGPFEKVAGWAITPPSELGQKNDFRDPQAYYDPATGSFSLTVTAGMDGRARILKYTVSKDLSKAKYDGVIFTDPTGDFWNMECSDTFRLGNKWYLTYSGQDDTLWYAMANSRFGPYSAPVRMEGKIFYAAKHVENGKDSYMVGWARKANSASSTYEVAGWAGNVAVQKLAQRADGSLYLVPVDAIVADFAAKTPVELETTQVTVTSEGGYSYQKAFTATESFMLKGEFTCAGTGTFGLAFDFNGKPENYKLISIDPKAGKLSLLLDQGDVPITETKLDLKPGEKHAFTYIQDGSIGIFYVDGKTALTVRVYGSTDKPVYLFAENNAVTFTSLKEYTR